MKIKILDLIDFEKVDSLLEGFNKTTGFVTAILDIEGKVLSKSGWRQICTEFHRVNPETSKKCTISDTILSDKMEKDKKYHFYQCLNGLIDVAVPIVIKGEHIANLFSGQFFFEEPDVSFFKKQAEKYGFDEKIYLKALKKVPVVSKEKVLAAMDFLLNMTQMISEMTFQKLEEMQLYEAIKKSEQILRLFVEHSPASIAMFDNNMRYLVASHRFLADYNLGDQNLIGRSHYEVFPEIPDRWKDIHRRCLAGETISDSNDLFPRADGTNDWVRWEIRPWYESENQIGGIILFSEVITSQIEDRVALKESEKYNRMLFEQSAIGLLLTSLEGKLIDINLACANIIGRTIKEAKALTYWEITPDKYQNQEKKQLESLAKTGRYGPYEKEYIHKDGHLVPVRLQGLIIERHNERFIWSSVEDISVQKKAELELITAKEVIETSERIKTDLLVKFNEAQQSAKIGNWDWDMVTNKVWWSDELYRIFDLSPSSFIPSVESNAKYVHPDDNGPYHKEVQRVIENKEELNTELRIISGNGTLKYCNSKAKLELDENGKPIRFYGTFADITERKKAELETARLFESEKVALAETNKAKEQLSQILERISDGFGSLDRNWNYTYVNEKLAQNVGRKREELLGHNIWKVFPEAIGTTVHKAYLRAMEKQVAMDLEHFYPHFGKWFQHRFYPSPDGLSFFSKDITESKLAEEKLKEQSSLIRIAAEKAKLGGWNVILDENRSYWSDEVAAIHEMPSGYAPLVEDGINFYAPEWRDRIIKVFTDCAQNGVPYDEELEILTSTGKKVWVKTIGEAVRDKNGKIFKVQGAFQDISERKMADEKNREKDLQFRKLSANVPDLLFQFTRKPDGTYFVPVASEGIRNIFGCSPEDVVDDFTPIGKVIHPDDAERVIADIEYSAKHLTYFTCEFRVQIPERPVQWILSRSTPEKLPDGSITWYGFNANITQRKEIEDALRESEEKYRYLFDNNPLPMWVYDLETLAFLEVNEAAINHYGYTRNEFKEITLKDIRPKEDIKRLLDDVKESSPIYNRAGTWRHQKKNGEIIFVEIIFHSINYNGNPARLVLANDVSERKKAEEALSHSHDLMKYIIEHNQSAIAVHDKNLNYLFVSRRFLEDFRVKEKDIIGKNHYEVFPDIPERWREVHQKALKGIVSRADEDIFFRKDGTFDWTRWECRPWFEVDGSIGGIILYLEVITGQKRKEEEIKKLNQRLEILIESIQQLSSVQSLDSVQDIVAKSARRLIGADGATLVFRENDHCSYVNEDAIQPLWKGKKFPLHSCISGWVMLHKKPVIIEDIFLDDRIPQDVYSPTFVKSLAMVPVNISEPIGAIGNYWKEKYTPTETELQLLQTLADSAARAIENINLYAELEERVKRRTEQLQAVNKELETFTYSVSHDLKAPLRGIDGYSKLLLDLYGSSLNDEAKHFISTIRSSTLQMNQLIEDLLQYSRLERSQILNEPLNLMPVIHSILKVNDDQITKFNFNIKVNVNDNGVIADSGGMQIVLRNLIENAIKFSKSVPNPEIKISLEENTESWTLSVKDNGVGFDMKYSQRIFEIFQRLHRAEEYPGTGIGLAMVSKAVQRMNGRVWAESMPGQGATFYIEIPKQI
jgi:PAS domain S-box-containing protein